MALRNGPNGHVLIADVDLIPSLHMYEKLRAFVEPPTDSSAALFPLQSNASISSPIRQSNSSSIPIIDASASTGLSLSAMCPEATRCAFVVPAFESTRTPTAPSPIRSDVPNENEWPFSKADLLRTGAHFQPFHARDWPQGHAATDSARWLRSDTPYEVRWAPGYEPYVVLRWRHQHSSVAERRFGLPHPEWLAFDERFVGFGWNKLAFCVLLDILRCL